MSVMPANYLTDSELRQRVLAMLAKGERYGSDMARELSGGAPVTNRPIGGRVATLMKRLSIEGKVTRREGFVPSRGGYFVVLYRLAACGPQAVTTGAA